MSDGEDVGRSPPRAAGRAGLSKSLLTARRALSTDPRPAAGHLATPILQPDVSPLVSGEEEQDSVARCARESRHRCIRSAGSQARGHEAATPSAAWLIFQVVSPKR